MKIGLALSGGGYRAAAYHIGTLNALDKLGILPKVDVISSVSGGSIIAAYYALHNNEKYQKIATDFATKLKVGVLQYAIVELLGILLLCGLLIWLCGWWIILIEILLIACFQFKVLPFSCLIEKRYNKHFFNRKTLTDLPVRPFVAINSTDVSTGQLFVFQTNNIYGYQYQDRSESIFKADDFPISKAVMASSCVPFVFSPITIPATYYKEKYYNWKKKPLLIDGGLYDNQGAHKLTEEQCPYKCDYIIVSDAGNSEINSNWVINTVSLLIKTSEILMRRIRNVQIQNNIYSHNNNGRTAYVSLMWELSDRILKGFINNAKNGNVSDHLLALHNISKEDINNIGDEGSLSYNAMLVKLKQNINWSVLEESKPSLNDRNIARSVGTNLMGLSSEKINALIRVSEWLTEVQVRLYMPELIEN